MNSSENSHQNLILVVGSTGGVGQLVVSQLLAKDLPVRILTRNAEKAREMFNDKVEIVVGDICEPSTLKTSMTNITSIICCTGTSAFPTSKWEFDQPPNIFELGITLFNPQFLENKAKNSPTKVDYQGVVNLLTAAPKNLNRFVLVSSCGILRKQQFPFKILNLFGVLDAKEKQNRQLLIPAFPIL